MTIQALCKQIGLQASVAMSVKEFIATYDVTQMKHILDGLTNIQTAEASYKKLAEILTDDQDQIKMLACQLLCATNIYEKYQEKGIPEEIYIDTMKCFTRFINECKEKNGKYAFDRAWWTYRQLSMVLFRIGELEYELTQINGKNVISIHIPSDACFTKENVDKSIGLAKEYISSFYPEYSSCDYICESWLLAPKLKELLEEDSNIISFQKRFMLVEQNSASKDIFEWLFKTTADTEMSQLKEDTSLQKKVKELLLRGENIGTALGVMHI